MSPSAAPESVPVYSAQCPDKLSADEKGEIRIVLRAGSNCADVLLEFDPKLIWVSGAGRVPGGAVFKLRLDIPAHSITFGCVNDSTVTATISIFFRDSTGTVLCAPDGGIDGRGDGRCPDFLAERKEERILWRAPKSS